MGPELIDQIAKTNKASLRCLSHLSEVLPENLRPDYQFLLNRAIVQHEILLKMMGENAHIGAHLSDVAQQP